MPNETNHAELWSRYSYEIEQTELAIDMLEVRKAEAVGDPLLYRAYDEHVRKARKYYSDMSHDLREGEKAMSSNEFREGMELLNATKREYGNSHSVNMLRGAEEQIKENLKRSDLTPRERDKSQHPTRGDRNSRTDAPREEHPKRGGKPHRKIKGRMGSAEDVLPEHHAPVFAAMVPDDITTSLVKALHDNLDSDTDRDRHFPDHTKPSSKIKGPVLS